MLAPLRDRHVWLVDPRGGIVPTYRPAAAVNFDRARWTEAMREAGYVARTRDLGDAVIGGYGYLFIGSWTASAGSDLLDAMLTRHRDAPGLILDLRVNAGGRDAAALSFVRRFTTRTFAASYVQVLTPVVPSVELPMVRTIAPGGPWQFTRPIVVIAGRGGLSATESFVAAMRTLPQVTVIGDTTGGASGNPAIYPLGNGWHFTVPRWMEYGPDQRPIEGLGVAPHLALPWSPATYADRRDPLIDAAVGLLAERIGVFRIAPLAPGALLRLDDPRTPH
jgi:C-terminal processing protease CtpA/Prc